MTALPFPTAPLPCAIVSYSLDEAEKYAAEKRIPQWFWVENVAAFDERGEVPLHVEYVGMHWRKRADVARLAEEIERRRARGLIR